MTKETWKPGMPRAELTDVSEVLFRIYYLGDVPWVPDEHVNESLRLCWDLLQDTLGAGGAYMSMDEFEKSYYRIR